MQMLHEDQLTGKTLGEYKIERLLGHGQLSAVYLAHHVSKRHAVIVTVFNYPGDSMLRQQFSTLFAREGATLVRLRHANILPTFDYGEQDGYPYLVTAFIRGASLAQALKQQERFTLKQTVNVLNQLASGLDEAHSQGVTHGILSLSNVLMSNEFTIQIAGFGLKTMLEAHAKTRDRQAQAHLFSANGAFLGSPEYISPERVQGVPAGVHSDIYALGVMLFEMLSGTPPFHAASPLETALKRIQQPAPSLHALSPSIPEAFDLVIGKALEREPARRYQHAGEIATAFERAMNMLETVGQSTAAKTQQLTENAQITLPPTINWFDEGSPVTGKWQIMPPIITGRLPVTSPAGPPHQTAHDETSGKLSAIQQGQFASTGPAAQPPTAPAASRTDSLVGVDPFAWWTRTAAKEQSPTPGAFTQRPPVRLAKSRSRRQPAQQDRRRVLKLIATGSAAAGVIAVGGISFAHFAQSLKQSQSPTASAPATAARPTTTTNGKTPAADPTTGTQKTATPSQSKTAKPSPTKASQPTPTVQPTQQPTPKPTQPPTPTPTQPSHTGTVIGNTNMSNNSAVNFNNPADGQGSLLIRLANGSFVACERACTHAGVPVDYDSGQQKLVCPAHGAIFDPFSGFAHTSGPGNGPLANVSIRVNADGTITTG